MSRVFNRLIQPISERFANFGTGEPWVARMMIGLPELFSGLKIGQDQTQELADSIRSIAMELGKGFEALAQLRSESASVIQREKDFDALYNHLWVAYKDRFPNAIWMIGYDIGFLYQKELHFNQGLSMLFYNHPTLQTSFGDVLISVRKDWQYALSEFRNEIQQHTRGTDHREMIKLKNVFYDISFGEQMFEYVWSTMEDISAIVLKDRLEREGVFTLGEIEEKARNQDCPKRFTLHPKQLLV